MPSRSSRIRLLNKIKILIYDNIRRLPLDYIGYDKSTYLSTLNEINYILKGWGNSYYFCNDRNLMNNLDREIDKQIQKFGNHYKRLIRNAKTIKEKRRLQGVHLLFDSKYNPIIKN